MDWPDPITLIRALYFTFELYFTLDDFSNLFRLKLHLGNKFYGLYKEKTICTQLVLQVCNAHFYL